tara:strand:- start:15165 stop:15404 length:240 start_codon:yes stop_codon:yes gene_type:complete
MDEYGEFMVPANSIYKDILSLISEHSITMTDTENKDILQEMIKEELKLVQMITEGNLLLARHELADIKRNELKNVTKIK